jgi:Fur family peroxide stress response transcriptional regulator
MMQLLSEICRQAGLKMTVPRVEVLRELARSGDDVTTDNLHDRIRTRLPTLSRSTVRRTLEELERLGVVHETGDEGKSVRRMPSSRPRRTAAGA